MVLWGTSPLFEFAEEFGGGPGSRALRTFPLPLKFLERQTARDAYAHALPKKPPPLLLEPPAAFERDPAPAVDDAVPGEPLLGGRSMKHPDDLSGSPMVSGESGDLGVSRHFAARDRLDYAFGPFFKFHCPA